MFFVRVIAAPRIQLRDLCRVSPPPSRAFVKRRRNTVGGPQYRRAPGSVTWWLFRNVDFDATSTLCAYERKSTFAAHVRLTVACTVVSSRTSAKVSNRRRFQLEPWQYDSPSRRLRGLSAAAAAAVDGVIMPTDPSFDFYSNWFEDIYFFFRQRRFSIVLRKSFYL